METQKLAEIATQEHEKLFKPQLKKVKEVEPIESPLEKLKRLENGKPITAWKNLLFKPWSSFIIGNWILNGQFFQRLHC